MERLFCNWANPAREIGFFAMKAPLAITLASAALFGGVVYFEESRISELDRQLELHRKNEAELQGRISRLTSDTENLDRQLKDSKALLEQLQSRLTKGDGASPKDATSTADAESNSNSGAKWMKGVAKMFTDPEMRKTMRTQQLMGIRMLYGDLAKELGLPPQETEQLLELLTDRQMEMMNAGMRALDSSNPNQASDKDRIAESTKRYEDQIKAVLGDDKFAKLKSYEGSIGDRFMLQQFEGQFGAAGAPLEGNQRQQLLDLMREEREKTPSNLNLSNSTNSAKQMEAMRNPEMLTKFVSAQEEFQKRVLDRSRQILSADQVGALEKMQQQQLEMIKMQMKMSRSMLGLDK